MRDLKGEALTQILPLDKGKGIKGIGLLDKKFEGEGLVNNLF